MKKNSPWLCFETIAILHGVQSCPGKLHSDRFWISHYIYNMQSIQNLEKTKNQKSTKVVEVTDPSEPIFGFDENACVCTETCASDDTGKLSIKSHSGVFIPVTAVIAAVVVHIDFLITTQPSRDIFHISRMDRWIAVRLMFLAEYFCQCRKKSLTSTKVSEVNGSDFACKIYWSTRGLVVEFQSFWWSLYSGPGGSSLHVVFVISLREFALNLKTVKLPTLVIGSFRLQTKSLSSYTCIKCHCKIC